MRKLLFLSLFCLSATAADYLKQTALVYRGPGACSEGCASAAAVVAKRAGYRVKWVTPDSMSKILIEKSALWIQPGGDAIEMANSLNQEQREMLRQYLHQGGRYLGICAGAFLADTYVDDHNTVPGLAVLPGVTQDFIKQQDDMVLPIQWLGQLRYLYFQGGPVFHLPTPSPVEVIARYTDGTPAGVRFAHGTGRVALIGPHPEAPATWKHGLVDPDGSDYDLADSLMNWLK